MSPLSSSEAGQARVDGGQGLGRFADPGESTVPQPGGGNLGRGDMVGAVPSASSAPVMGQRWPCESYGRARLHVNQVTMEILLGKLRATFLLHLFPFDITYVKQKVKSLCLGVQKSLCWGVQSRCYRSTMGTKGVLPGFPPIGDGPCASPSGPRSCWLERGLSVLTRHQRMEGTPGCCPCGPR